MQKTIATIFLNIFFSAAAFSQVVVTKATDYPDAFQLKYFANLSVGDAAINLTNAGVLSGFDPAGTICANMYVFAQDQQLAACCTCSLTPNHLRTLSVQKDLLSNLLTPGVPTAITVAIAATTSANGSCTTATASTFTANQLVPGLRAWGTTLHALPGGGYTISDTEFSQVTFSTSEMTKVTQYCGFIQAIGSGYGICASCRDGAAGADKQ